MPKKIKILIKKICEVIEKFTKEQPLLAKEAYLELEQSIEGLKKYNINQFKVINYEY